jgi:predicted amidohydrolase YtcJ
LGRLSVGYPADFAIVDRDPLNAPAGELRSVRVIATYVGGEPVYPAWRAHSFGRSRD